MNTFDKFKTEIDLTEYAGSLGYAIDKEKSTPKYILMRKGGDVVICSKNKATGEHHYYNPNDASDKGDIISFAKNRMFLLPSVEVPNYVKNEEMFKINQSLSSFKGHVFSEPFKKQNNSSFKLELYKYYPVQDGAVLNERGIENEVLNDPLFKGKIHNSEFKGKVNIAFPLENEKEKIVGFDFRNRESKKLAKGSNREEGMWTSNLPEKTEKIVVAESPIDLISYHQLHPSKGNYYMATHGSITQKHIDRIISSSRETGAKIALAQDADSAGYVMSLKVIAAVGGIPLKPVKERMAISLEKDEFKKVVDAVKEKNNELRRMGGYEEDLIRGGEKDNKVMVHFVANVTMLKFFCNLLTQNLKLNAALDMPTKGKDYNEQLQLKKNALKPQKNSFSL